MRRRVSPTRILRTIACPRVPAYEAVHGRPPSTKAQDNGKLGHKMLEDWFKDGTVFDIATDIGSRVLRALAHLPGPDKKNLVKSEVALDLVRDGVEWIGYADLLEAMDDAGTEREDSRAVVHDYKTTADPKYAETEESLPESVQFVFYAEAVLEKCPSLREVSAQWTYVRTRGKKESWPVRSRWYSREEIGAKFLVLNKIAAIVADLPARPSRLPRHYQSCGNFGGCPFRAHCKPKPTAAESTAALFKPESKHMNLLEMLDEATDIENNVLPEDAPTEPGDFPVEGADDTAKEETAGNGPFANPIDTTAKDKVEKTPEPAKDDELVDPAPFVPTDEVTLVTETPKRGRGRPRKVVPDAPAPELAGTEILRRAETEQAKHEVVSAAIDEAMREGARVCVSTFPQASRELVDYNVREMVVAALQAGRRNDEIAELLTIAKDASRP